MRVLFATAGLLFLAGTTAVAAGPPTPQTMRKSPNGPIEAIAQDGSSIAWLTSGGTRACDAVHLLSPATPDRILPQPASTSMTCHWDLTDGEPQVAVASGISTALWTLHESGPSPFDDVVAASVGDPERQIVRLARASDGTGKWLGGVAGSGRTLAYSWDDVEYVDKLGCLSGGSCKQKIADGGIRIVTPTGDQPLPDSQPALGLAASAGRIAYIPATLAKAGRPSPSTDSSIDVVDGTTGDPVSQAFVHGLPLAIALSPNVLAVLTTQAGPHDRISWFSVTGQKKLGSVLVSRLAAPQLATSDQLIVYRVNRSLFGVSTHGGQPRLLTKTAQDTIGFSLGKGQLVWAENRGGTGRLRALAVSS